MTLIPDIDAPQAVVVPWSDLPSWKDAAAGSPLPILVSRPCSSKQAVAELRAACDGWRDEWAGLELAGFIV